MTRQQRYQAQRRAEGKCPQCGKPVVPVVAHNYHWVGARCATCRARGAERARLKRQPTISAPATSVDAEAAAGGADTVREYRGARLSTRAVEYFC